MLMSRDRMVLETAASEPDAALVVVTSRLGFHTLVRLGNKSLRRLRRAEVLSDGEDCRVFYNRVRSRAGSDIRRFSGSPA